MASGEKKKNVLRCFHRVGLGRFQRAKPTVNKEHMQLIWQRSRPSIPFLSVLFIMARLPLNSIFGKYTKSFSSGAGEGWGGLEGRGLTHMTLKQFVSARPVGVRNRPVFRMSFGGISRGRSCASREESETVEIPTAFARQDEPAFGSFVLAPGWQSRRLRPSPGLQVIMMMKMLMMTDRWLGIRARAVKTKRPLF